MHTHTCTCGSPFNPLSVCPACGKDRTVEVGLSYDAYSVSGEYYLGSGTVTKIVNPMRCILDNALNVPVICCQEKS